MNVVIIEDEKLAAEHLQKLVEKAQPNVHVLKVMDSVKKSIEWFLTHPSPDLIFMDIQLADGLSFDIFDKVEIKAPIIFTTAFDEYAIRAFKLNSIDYLLKPISIDDVKHALHKFSASQPSTQKQNIDQGILEKVLNLMSNNYKNRFVIKVGEHLRFINTDEISYFRSMEKATFLQTSASKSYAIDYSLDELENLVEPKKFFRINRKYIIGISFINDIVAYTNSRLKLKVTGSNEDDMIVSREKVQEFKKWLEG